MLNAQQSVARLKEPFFKHGRTILTTILVAVIVAALSNAVTANGGKKDKAAGMDMRCMGDMNGVPMDEMGPA